MPECSPLAVGVRNQGAKSRLRPGFPSARAPPFYGGDFPPPHALDARRPTSPLKRPPGVRHALDDEDARRTSEHYQRIAADYDRQVDGEERNRATREAFRTHVSALAGRGGAILDFGCGTGIDAAWYAERGHRWWRTIRPAAMLALLRARAADAISRGEIVVVEGPFDALWTALAEREPLDAIAANFAVLNHVRDLRPLLQRLAGHLRPGGTLSASLLNALQRGAIRTRWWPREALRSLATGSIATAARSRPTAITCGRCGALDARTS